MSKRRLACIIAVSLVVGAAIQSYTSSYSRVKAVLSESETKENDVVTIIKESTNKDGSSQKETKIVDKSKTKSEREQKIDIVEAKPASNWMLYAASTYDRVYSGGVQRRILGNIFLGVYADTERRLGVSVGILF